MWQKAISEMNNDLYCIVLSLAACNLFLENYEWAWKVLYQNQSFFAFSKNYYFCLKKDKLLSRFKLLIPGNVYDAIFLVWLWQILSCQIWFCNFYAMIFSYLPEIILKLKIDSIWFELICITVVVIIKIKTTVYA